ncbi:acid-activated periplasmic chaperone HdeA [Bordetella avium]|uniref:acid-activated periplasmic chaperone HdeA n=1 Tax=Bordetella avium TaxID=521 RepID=UPI000E0C44D3|nr:acid-activated periplasmic chaperone HdeA [Bordetella avium]AZY50165.1 acid-resistance protein [Bordetella avium]AZY53560.1 acid-resistance protein [Bordetella avium]RIQ11846.1 acid-resistance protein [Bordetella avium]RIQ16322.1 acid-resistance protein [Bordetella avium]RIQ33962.1 acid-resistance protein [Bordetella avium]
MKKIIISLSIAAATLSFSGTALADAKKPMPLWQCSDYLQLNESYRPVALGFAEAVNRKGKPEDDVVDIEGIAQITPTLVTYCQENPKVALTDALAQTKANAANTTSKTPPASSTTAK